MFLTKDDLNTLTGLKQAKAITKWLKNNPDTLSQHKLVFAGYINAVGLPIVEKLESTRKDDAVNS